MNNTSGIETKRAEFLNDLKQVVQVIYQRERWFNALCPQLKPDDAERGKALKQISSESKHLGELIGRLSQIGQDGSLGFQRLLGFEPDEVTATVMALLVACRLDSSVSTSMRAVDDLSHFVANRDPVVALQIRNLFRADGKLFPFVTVRLSLVLDEATVILRESAFNRVMGQASDVVEARCEAEALIGRGR